MGEVEEAELETERGERSHMYQKSVQSVQMKAQKGSNLRW